MPDMPRSLLVETAMALARLAAIGLIAIGLSALVALGMGAVWGKSFVAGDLPGVTYTTSRCAELFEYAPHARTCEQAATEHHFDETVTYRGAAGVLGVAAAIAYGWLRRRRPRRAELLPAGFEATVATTAFGLAASLLLAQGVGDLFVSGHAGAGGWLSGGIVSLGFACVFVVSLWRALLREGAARSG